MCAGPMLGLEPIAFGSISRASRGRQTTLQCALPIPVSLGYDACMPPRSEKASSPRAARERVLTATPKNLFSWTYEIADRRGHIATVSLHWLREAGRLVIDQTPYSLGREGWISGVFYLDSGRARLASATKQSVLTRSFDLEIDNETYVLRPKSMFRRAFVLESRGKIVGEISPTSLFSRGAEADLPLELSVAARIFVLWLVILMWRRAAASSHS